MEGSAMTSSVTLSSDPPAPPPDAEFAFVIDFVKGSGSASRIFGATHDFIKACEALDAELVQSIDASIETIMVLEDIQIGSIKTWLRSALTSVNDDALKDLDWKKAVGKYLVDAKYAVITWTESPDAPATLPALRRELQQIASNTDVRHLPDYAPPSPGALIKAMADIQGVKSRLISGDRAIMVTPTGDVEMNLSIHWNVDDIEALAVARTLTSPPAQMILAVKRPDYLGASMWDLRHGKRTVQAKMEDANWLKKFQARAVDVRPGDALRCMVATKLLYGHDNELLSEHFSVVEVLEVLPNTIEIVELPFGELSANRE